MVVISILLLLVLLLIGMPIGFVLLFVGAFGISITVGFDSMFSLLSTTPYRSVNNFALTAVPLFIFMANLISKSRIADDLFNVVLKWVGHTPGGAGVSTIAASAGFGALSGSSVAATSVMSQIAVPKMVQAKYSPSFASGLVASTTGTLAALIPPSIPLIIYGIQTETSVGKLLMAGIFPAILLAVLLCITVVFVGIKLDCRTEKFTWRERWQSLKYVWPILLLISFVMSIIYFGIATTTEAAAFGAFGALVLCLLMKRLNMKLILDSLIETGKSTAMIFIIIIGATLFSYYIALTKIGDTLVGSISSSGLSPLTVLFILIIFYLILGMFLDLMGSMLLTLPLVYPLIVSLGYDPIWFGVVLVLLLEIGLVTPPVGINLFITSQTTKIPVLQVFYGAIPFLLVMLVTVGIMIVFPQIALYLPSVMLE